LSLLTLTLTFKVVRGGTKHIFRANLAQSVQRFQRYFIHKQTNAQQQLRLATIGCNRRGPKFGAVPLFCGGAGSPSNTTWPGPRPAFIPSGILIHTDVWPQQTWAENRRGAAVPPFWGGTGSLSNTVWPWLRPTFVPSGILIHPAVWPQ